MLHRERREAQQRARADYRPDNHYEYGRIDKTFGSCSRLDDDAARVLLDVADDVAPGQAFVGIDRNAEDIYLFAVTPDKRAIQFVLTAHEVYNRIGGFNQKARTASRRGRNLARRGNAGHMAASATADAVAAIRKRHENAIPRRKKRKLFDIVRSFIQSVVDYITGRFSTDGEPAQCTIFCGDANFRHNMRGGLTWISVDALLKACASVTTTYAVNEYFSSQKCAFCTHFVQRKGDYKHAHCPNCGIDVPRDLMAAACMARIGLWWMVNGEREDAFTAKSHKKEPVAGKPGKTTAASRTPPTPARTPKRTRAASEQDAAEPAGRGGRSMRPRRQEPRVKRKRPESPIPGTGRVTRRRTSAQTANNAARY